MSDFLPPTLQQQTFESLESEVQRFRLAHQASEATLAMTVARLGGKVEGAPTQRINFLQRVDELRRIETLHHEMREALKKLVACHEFLSHRQDTAEALEAGREALRKALDAEIPTPGGIA